MLGRSCVILDLQPAHQTLEKAFSHSVHNSPMLPRNPSFRCKIKIGLQSLSGNPRINKISHWSKSLQTLSLARPGRTRPLTTTVAATATRIGSALSPELQTEPLLLRPQFAVAAPSSRLLFYTKSSLFINNNNSRMASDEDYMAFLNKANQDPNEGYSSSKPKTTAGKKDEFKTTDADVEVPAVLVKAGENSFYVSDADEPFVPVCLRWDEGSKGLPDEEEFASLISHPDPSSAQISIQDTADWDPRGQYADVVDAVRKAGKGSDVRVYRVARDGARVEYWVVTAEGKGKGARLVGLKALAIES